MTQTCPSKQHCDMLKSKVDLIRKAWFNTDDKDVDATNELMCDLLNEVEDFLTGYQGPTGN